MQSQTHGTPGHSLLVVLIVAAATLVLLAVDYIDTVGFFKYSFGRFGLHVTRLGWSYIIISCSSSGDIISLGRSHSLIYRKRDKLDLHNTLSKSHVLAPDLQCLLSSPSLVGLAVGGLGWGGCTSVIITDIESLHVRDSVAIKSPRASDLRSSF